MTDKTVHKKQIKQLAIRTSVKPGWTHKLRKG